MNHLIAFSLGPVDVYRYGIMYFVGFLLGYILLRYGQKHGWYRGTNADIVIEKDLDGLILALLIGVMFGGRLGHVFIYDFSYFVAHPSKIFAFRDGGMSFIGGILGVAFAVFLYIHYFSPLKKTQNKNIWSLLDAMIPIIPLGIFFGRIGNFLNQELYGIVVKKSWGISESLIRFMTDLGLFYNYQSVDNLLRVNANVLAMIFEGLLLSIILWICFFKKTKTKKRKSGQLSFLFLGLYSFVRFFLEYIRQDSQAEFVGIFTKSQRFFVIFFLIALVGFLRLSRQNKNNRN